MNPALETLFYPFEKSLIGVPDSQHKILFLGAQYIEFIEKLEKHNIVFQQDFKPYAAQLESKNIAVSPQIQTEDNTFDTVLALLPKNNIEAKYVIARGIKLLKRGGTFLCCAPNDAGGSRIQKMLGEFGLSDIDNASKNKCRVAWGMKINCDETFIENAITAGSEQTIINDEFMSQPGIFGWNKIDRGSEILTHYIPNDLKGTGADFGCGYGYLSRFALSHCPKIKTLHAIDADHRAVEMTSQNLTSLASPRKRGSHENAKKDPCLHGDANIWKTLWADLTSTKDIPNNLDFIIMNPPFHEGKKTDTDIGVSFIKTAHTCLKRNGILYMVANAGLPYEVVLGEIFFEVEKCHEGQGFKVFKAKK